MDGDRSRYQSLRRGQAASLCFPQGYYSAVASLLLDYNRRLRYNVELVEGGICFDIIWQDLSPEELASVRSRILDLSDTFCGRGGSVTFKRGRASIYRQFDQHVVL